MNSESDEKFEEKIKSYSNLRIIKVNTTSVNKNYFNVVTSLESIPGSTPTLGGINFTSAEISYIDACNPEQGINFVMKAKKANAGDTLINLNDVTSNFTRFFKSALVIPNC